MKKEIIDNETENYKLFQLLNESLEKSNKEISVATGFFNISGYNLLKENLWKLTNDNNSQFKLLFGKETISYEEINPNVLLHLNDQPNSHNDLKNSNEVENTIKDELIHMPITENTAKLVDNLIEFLKKNNVFVRNNKNRFNHAKCYIFDDSVIVGSSNLTGAGLAGNVELNAVLYQPSQMNLVRQWFERRWNESEDVKDSLIKLLEESKFGLPLEPFQMYMKILYEYYKPRLKDLERSKTSGIELTEFQHDAVTAALRILRKYNGVIIADSTGLGKTHIGLDLLRELVAVKRKKTLLIAPAQVLDSVWEPRLLEQSIKTKNVSLEKTGTSSFEPTDYLDFDLVVIDESHNFRSSSSKRRDNLMKVLAGGRKKQVILLTATPVNNSLLDLYHQISLITAGDDTHFADLGIADLRRYFVSADRKEFATGIDDIVRLLDEIMIRRTRLFIKENYPDATLNGNKLSFPKRKLHKVEYSLTALFGNEVYKQVIDTIDKLHLVPYSVNYYNISSDRKEQLEAEQRATLQKFGLLKRFESSIEAIKKSIERLEKFYDYFDLVLSNGKILDSKTFHKILSDLDENEEGEEEDAFLNRLEEEVDLIPLTNEYDQKMMKADLKADRKILSPLKESLNKIQPFADRKLTALKEQFIKDNVFESGGKKVVIFTQFVDTAKYIHKELKKDFSDKEVLILTGKTERKTRDNYLKKFAPKANFGENIEKEADVLVSTDVLSEGQNLQDANYVVNYDLPWNPMKIVQRVGRVDRLTSQFREVISTVFIPEKELEDILGLLTKLETKIKKAAETVGVEATILGEKENPKNFNATSRIMKGDSSLIDEMERSSELLPMETPLQKIMSYMKKVGLMNLESIPLGKRSGMKSDQAGLILVYREKVRTEEIHMTFYDYKKTRFDHINDISWIFKKISCEEQEPLFLPLSGNDAFSQIIMIDGKARSEILTSINAPIDARQAQKMGGKNQREIRELIKNAYTEGQISNSEVSSIYSILNKNSLIAWEEEFIEFLDDYKRTQDIRLTITSLGKLFNRYKIESRLQDQIRRLAPTDLTLVACVFLSDPEMKNWKIAI